jgi:hypothetical protein
MARSRVQTGPAQHLPHGMGSVSTHRMRACNMRKGRGCLPLLEDAFSLGGLPPMSAARRIKGLDF